jgi:hypothetical protein
MTNEVIFLNLPNPSGRTRPLGFTHPLTEMSIRNIMFLGSKVRRVSRDDNLTAICEPSLDTVGSLTSHKPIGLQGLLRE